MDRLPGCAVVEDRATHRFHRLLRSMHRLRIVRLIVARRDAPQRRLVPRALPVRIRCPCAPRRRRVRVANDSHLDRGRTASWPTQFEPGRRSHGLQGSHTRLLRARRHARHRGHRLGTTPRLRASRPDDRWRQCRSVRSTRRRHGYAMMDRNELRMAGRSPSDTAEPRLGPPRPRSPSVASPQTSR